MMEMVKDLGGDLKKLGIAINADRWTKIGLGLALACVLAAGVVLGFQSKIDKHQKRVSNAPTLKK